MELLSNLLCKVNVLCYSLRHDSIFFSTLLLHKKFTSQKSWYYGLNFVASKFICWNSVRSRHTRSHPWQGHEGENLTGRVYQVFRGFEKASSQDPTHDKVTRRKPDRQGRSGFQGFWKATPGAHLKDDICLSDACFNRILPNFCDTGTRPSLISSQIRINLEL